MEKQVDQQDKANPIKQQYDRDGYASFATCSTRT